jgi:hypothetical protein
MPRQKPVSGPLSRADRHRELKIAREIKAAADKRREQTRELLARMQFFLSGAPEEFRTIFIQCAMDVVIDWWNRGDPDSMRFGDGVLAMLSDDLQLRLSLWYFDGTGTVPMPPEYTARSTRTAYGAFELPPLAPAGSAPVSAPVSAHENESLTPESPESVQAGSGRVPELSLPLDFVSDKFTGNGAGKK